jgi:uncharacterized protein
MTTTDQELREQTLALMGQYQTLLTEQRFDEWIELWAEDGVCEFPYAPADRPRRLCGRQEIYEYMSSYPSRLAIDGVEDLRVHPGQDPCTIVVEMKVKGTATETGRPYDQQYVFIARAEDGRIAHYREYWNPVLAAEAFAWQTSSSS